MRRLSYVKLMLLVALLVGAGLVSTGQPTLAAKSCPNAPVSRLVINRQARVTPGTPNNLRDKPSKTGNVLTQVQPNELVDITDGPTCADGFAWWQVNYNSQIGWMAEGSGTKYYLDPTTSDVATFKVADGTTNIDVQLGNVKFTYNSLFGTQVEADTVYAYKGTPDDPFFVPMPEYTDFILKSDTITDSYLVPHLSVYPVADYEKLSDQDKQRIEGLKTLLAKKPKTITDEIPVLPMANAAQVFHSNVNYIDFDGGSGVGFVTMYGQDVSPITSDRLRYYFQGLSTDGNYLIAANFPITSDVVAATYDADKNFPDLSGNNAGDLYTKYVKDTVAKLNKATSDHFTPALDDITTLLQSISIQ